MAARRRRLVIRALRRAAIGELIVGLKTQMQAEPNSKTRASRRGALVEGTVRIFISLCFLVGGWILPAFYINHDPIMRSDSDLRIGPVFPICALIGAVFAVMALRSFARAFGSSAPRTGPE